MSHPKLNASRLAAFVSPEAPFAAFLTALVVFIPPFYAGSVGLGLGTVGMIFGLTKLWDVVTDPVFGVVSDRWYTRWGRRRPWMIASVPLLGLCTYMVFIPPASATGDYFALWMILLYIGWTIGTVSHISWAAELSSEYHERSRISAYKQAAALLGTLGVFGLAATSDYLFDADEQMRMTLIAICLLVLLPVTVFTACFAAPEPKPEKAHTEKPIGIFKALRSSKPLRRLLTTNVLLGIATGAVGGMILFYTEHVLKLGKWTSLALVPFLLSALIMLPIFVSISRKIGKHRTLCVAMVYQIIASCLYLVMPAHSLLLASLAFLLLGANQAVGTYIPRAIMADVSDLSTSETGRQQTGFYMALLQSSSKIAAALAVGLSYPVLSWIGFDPSPDAINSEQTLFALRATMVLFPGFMFALVILIMWNFPLTEDFQKEIRRKIEQAA